MLTSQNLNWIAGIVEGEGYIGWIENRPILAVDMTDQDIVERLASFWNTKVMVLKTKEGFKQKYRVRVSGTRAASWIMTLYSLMGKRRQHKILTVLDQWKVIRKKGPKPKCQK